VTAEMYPNVTQLTNLSESWATAVMQYDKETPRDYLDEKEVL
jgi:hypothetical protein